MQGAEVFTVHMDSHSADCHSRGRHMESRWRGCHTTAVPHEGHERCAVASSRGCSARRPMCLNQGGFGDVQGSPRRWARAKGRRARRLCPAFPLEAGGPAAEARSSPRLQTEASSMHQLLWEFWVKTAVQTGATNPFSWEKEPKFRQ